MYEYIWFLLINVESELIHTQELIMVYLISNWNDINWTRLQFVIINVGKWFVSETRPVPMYRINLPSQQTLVTLRIFSSREKCKGSKKQMNIS